MMVDIAILNGLNVPTFRILQSKTPLRPYEYIFEADRWSPRSQSTSDRTITEGWVWASFPTVPLRPPIAWDEVCSHRSHQFHLHAWYFLGPVLQSYHHTRDLKYLEFANLIALDWTSQFPSTDTQSMFAWYDVAIAARAYRLAYIIDASARVKSVPDDVLERLLAGAAVHAQALADDTRFAKHSNHGFYFAAGQLALARRLSLVPGMGDAAHQARERLLSLIATQFTDEGGQREHSPHYHSLVLGALSGLMESGLLGGEELEQLRDRAQEALAWFILPNGHLVNFGDSDQLPMTTGESSRVRNEVLRFALTGGREGRPPVESLRAFPATGYAIIRNNWSTGPEKLADGSYLAQICGFHSNVHKHFDELSFVWYDRGHELLVDAGRFAYLYEDPNRIYVESTHAHNTVTVDGRSWARRGSRRPYGSALRRWGEADGIFYTETEVRHWKTIQHTRVLLFRPADWLIVLDWLSDDSSERHEFTQRFLFAPELDVEEAGSALTLSLSDGVNKLHMVPLLASEALTPVKGQREPEMLGWISRKFGTMTPCWSGGYRATNRSRHAFATLFAFGDEPPQTTGLVSSCDDSGRQVQLHWQQAGMARAVAFSRPKTGQFTLSYRVGNGGSWEWPNQPKQEKVPRMKYDLALFEQLNEEYRERPIVDVAKTRERRKLLSPQLLSATEAEHDTVTRSQRAQFAATSQLRPILKDLDLNGKVVLELGCGHGWLTAILPDEVGAARAIGVDVERYSSWPNHKDSRVELFEADLSKEQVVPLGSIDTIISNVTFEHVSRPLQMLSALYDLLKDGGEAWLRMNVFTSRTASHKYSEIFFPWPHLLFDDEVCEQFYRKHHNKSGQRFSWVNHMTVAHYLQAVREIGFDVTRVGRSFVPIDLPFYLRFADKLGRYAALDLETDFLTLVLRKSHGRPDDEASRTLDFEYIDRERELDNRILGSIGGDTIISKDRPQSQGPVQPAVKMVEVGGAERSLVPALETASSVHAAPTQTMSEPQANLNINTPAYWDRVYRKEWESGEVFSATYARDYGPIHDAIMAYIPQNARVLDVACGSGLLCHKIKERYPHATVMGVDHSQYTIDRNQWVDQNSGNEYVCLNVQTSLLSLARTFNVVIMAEIVEHLDDPTRTIADAVDLLSPGGSLIITCPHDDAIPSKEHVRQWGHDELFHILAPFSNTVCFTHFPDPFDKWMMAHLTKPA